MAGAHGVSRYVATQVTIFFPDSHFCCDLCPLLETYSRKQCRRTGEYLLDTRVTVGSECPLIILNKEEKDVSTSERE